jgi:hypothetical protein
VKELSPSVRILYNCPSRREIFPVAFLSSLADGRDHEFTFSSSDGMKKTSKVPYCIFLFGGLLFWKRRGTGRSKSFASIRPPKNTSGYYTCVFFVTLRKKDLQKGVGAFLMFKNTKCVQDFFEI